MLPDNGMMITLHVLLAIGTVLVIASGFFCGQKNGAGLHPLQMQVRIFPVRESSLALKRGAAKMVNKAVVLIDIDLPSDEQMLAFGAVPQFVQGPPLFKRIIYLEELKLSPLGQYDGMHGCGWFYQRLVNLASAG